jgi:hypothetical protein
MLSIRFPDIYIFRVGNLLAPLCIPFGLALYFFRLVPSFLGLPVHGKLYKLTNRRVIELRNEVRLVGLRPRFRFGVEMRSVPLDRFNAIEVVRQPGQAWFDAGDLVFRDGTTETFRLDGVKHPQSVRQACLKAHMAYVGVKAARRR